MYLKPNTGLIAASYRDAPAFPVLVPSDVADAAAILADVEAPVPYAGGTHLCAEAREGRPIGTLVWLKALDEMRGVSVDGRTLSIGALTTHAEGASAEASQAVPGFAHAWSKMGKMRIRLAATIGGNLMARHTRYEMSIVLTALGGVLRFASKTGDASLQAGDLWSASGLERSLLTRIEIPLQADLRLDYDRSLRPIMTQALALWTDDKGRSAGRAVIATEYLQPVALDLDLSGQAAPKDVAAAAFEALPAEFADPATGNAYLRQAGAALLARQLGRIAGEHG